MYKIFIFLMFIINSFSQNCVIIQGGGFSGFWYFYKQSQSIDKSDKIYCVSSGCLAIVSSIKNNNFNNTLDTVLNIKNSYENQRLSIFDVREKFVDTIVDIPIDKYNINIITSNYFGKCNIKRPRNSLELKKYLLETSNIPFITSKFCLKTDIDGVFCKLNHPKCNIIHSIPKTKKFLLNILNPFISLDDVEYFYNY